VFSLVGKWSFTMAAPIGVITPTLTDAQFTAQQQAVSNAILALGGGGATESQPLCTLNRYFRQPSSQLPSHAVFVVITDSDDTHAPSDCLDSYDHTAVPSTGQTNYATTCPTSSACDQYVYEMTAPSNATQLSYQCVPVDDTGVKHPEQATARTLWVGYGAACPATTTCTSDQLRQATTDCSSIIGSNNVVENCAVSCTSGGDAYCELVRTNNSANLCSGSFSEGGVTYANLADYCTKSQPGRSWSNCNVVGEDFVDGGQQTTYYEEDKLVPVIPSASTAADLVTQFRLSAARTFGASGYAIETIQLDPSFSCPVGAGQSYGATLKTLATSASDVFPLCGDYSAALKALQGFADGLVPSSYPVTLQAGEVIAGVTVVDGSGTRRVLPAADYTYDMATRSLDLTAGALQVGDANVLVTVESDCGPR
jgi:hypothetical protein